MEQLIKYLDNLEKIEIQSTDFEVTCICDTSCYNNSGNDNWYDNLDTVRKKYLITLVGCEVCTIESDNCKIKCSCSEDNCFHEKIINSIETSERIDEARCKIARCKSEIARLL